MTDIVKRLEQGLAPIRTGRLRTRNASGIYKPKAEVIRLRKANDIYTITHEAGHHIQKLLFPDPKAGRYSKGLSKQSFPRQFHNELESMAYAGAKPDRLVQEGFAEFVRLYLTDPAKAAAQAPRFTQEFERRLGQPEMAPLKDLLDSTRRDYELWQAQGAEARVRSTIDRDPAGREKRPMGERLDQFWTDWVDDLRPLQRAVSEIARGRDVPAAADPYKTARRSRGVGGIAEAWLRHGITDGNGQRIGKGLEEILEPVRRDLNGFGDFLIAQHALDVLQAGLPMPLPAADYQAVVSAAPQSYQDAFSELREYQNALLDRLVDAGLMDANAKAQMNARWAHYVPLYRVQREGRGGKKPATSGPPIRRLRGSGRDIIDPLESIVKNTYVFLAAAERNRVFQQLARLADQNVGAGAWVERVPPKMERVAYVSLGEVLNSQDAMSMGVPLDALDTMGADIFRPAYKPSGKEDVVVFWEGGQPSLLQLHPDLRLMFEQMDASSANVFAQILGPLARLLRAGAILTPEFSGRNIMRDVPTALIQSRSGIKPADLLRAVFTVVGKDDLYWQWQASGGAQSSLVSGDRNYYRKAVRTLGQSTAGRVLDIATHPLDALRGLSEFFEEIPRVAEFSRQTNRGRSSDPDAVAQGALNSRDVTVDFSRQGKKAREWNKVVAFFTAAVGGTVRFAESMVKDPVRTSLRTLLYITIPSLLLYLRNRDDEDYERLPEFQRDYNWFIPLGEGEGHGWLRIPKPHQIGVFFGSSVERAFRFLDEQDPYALDEYVENLIRSTGLPLPTGLSTDGLKDAVKSMIPTAMRPWIDIWSNQSFSGSPIVPRREEGLPPEQQAGPDSSTVARIIARPLGVSPRQVDYAIHGTTGGLGRMVTQGASAVIDAVTGEPGGTPRRDKFVAETPVLRAFTVNPWTASVDVGRLYEEKAELDRREAGSKQDPSLALARDEEARRKVLSDGSAQLSAIRAAAREIEAGQYSGRQKRDALYVLSRLEDDIAAVTLGGAGKPERRALVQQARARIGGILTGWRPSALELH